MSFNPWIWRSLPGADSFSWVPEPLTPAQLATITEAAEIYERRLQTHGYHAPSLIGLLTCLLGPLTTERAYAVYFGRGNAYLGRRRIADGAPGRVYPSSHRVARLGVELGAESVVFAHCHPAGRELPSGPDLDHVLFLGAALSRAGLALIDSIVVAGPRFRSLSAHREPPEAWLHLGSDSTVEITGQAEEDEPLDEVIAKHDAWRIICNFHQCEPPATDEELRDIAHRWMAPRTASTLGVLALDPFRRPISCEIVTREDWLVGLTRFVVSACCVNAVFVVHAPDAEQNWQALADMAAELQPVLNAYDIGLYDCFSTDRNGAQSLRSSGNFPGDEKMRLNEVFSGIRRKAAKASAEQAAGLKSIAEKKLSGASLTRDEVQLLKAGAFTEEQVAVAAEALQRFESKLAAAVNTERRRQQKVPQIKAAQARLPELQKELISTRQLALSSAASPDYQTLHALAAEHRELFPEFADAAALRAHVEERAAQPVVQAVA